MEPEREKILEYLRSRNIPMKEKDIFQKRQSTEIVSGITYYVIPKKKNGECLFLQKDKSCVIQPVKPLDCLFWPLTLELDPDNNEIDVLLGDCFFTREIKKLGLLEEWLAKEKENILQKIHNFSKNDLIAFNSLDNIPKFKILFSISLAED
jgi:Fe-S-cluster containining protein